MTSEAIDQAVVAAKMISSAFMRSRALVDVATELSASNSDHAVSICEEAIATANDLEDPGWRDQALAYAAPGLVGIDPNSSDLLLRATERVESITGTDWRARAFARIATKVASSSDVRASELIGRAIEVTAAEPSTELRDRSLAALIEEISGLNPKFLGDSRAAIDLANSIEDAYLNKRALADIAEGIAESSNGDLAKIDEAVAVARKIPSPGLSAVMIDLSARSVDDFDPEVARGLVIAAVEVASSDQDEEKRDWSLGRVLPRLVELHPGDTERVREATELANSLSWDYERNGALAEIAKAAAESGETTVVELREAIAAAHNIPSQYFRDEALLVAITQLAKHDLNKSDLTDEAMSHSSSIEDPVQRGWAIFRIATALVGHGPDDPAVRRRAIGLARAIPEPEPQCHALSKIATHLLEEAPLAKELLDEATTAASTIADPAEMSRALSTVAFALKGLDNTAALAALVAATDALTGTEPGAFHSDELAQRAMDFVKLDPGNSDMMAKAVELAGLIEDPSNREFALSMISRDAASNG